MKKYDLQNSEVRTWLEIDTAKLRHNYLEFRELIGKKCLLLAVVKSNAYGHGLIDYSKALDKIGVDWFGVDSFVEARKLREAGIKKPVLVLGYTLLRNFDEAAKLNVSLTVSSLEQLREILRLSASRRIAQDINLKMHLKIDTVMHRQGVQLDELPEVLKILKSMKNIKLEGIYSHFAAAGDGKYISETQQQIKNFRQAVEIIEAAGFQPIKHLAATGGAIAFPENHFDMVRIGIGLMGLWPSEEIKTDYCDKVKLEPILSWKTVISEIKSVKKYEKIGYGFTETLKRDSKIAILPIGYWHGFRRSLSSIGWVLIHGQRCKVLGRVSMDMTTIDVTDLKSVKVGDTVTLIGRDQTEEITVEEMAELAGSYSYEIITTINPLIKKIYR